MKKVLALVLALTMVLGMGSVALAEGNAQVFWYTMSDTYLASVRTALNAKLDEAGITYVDQDGNATQTPQNDQITNAIATGTDLLGVRHRADRGRHGHGCGHPDAVLQPFRFRGRVQEL